PSRWSARRHWRSRWSADRYLPSNWRQKPPPTRRTGPPRHQYFPVLHAISSLQDIPSDGPQASGYAHGEFPGGSTLIKGFVGSGLVVVEIFPGETAPAKRTTRVCRAIWRGSLASAESA